MKIHYSLLLAAFALLPWATGCPKPANTTAEVEEHEGEEHEGDEHGHSHAGEDDALFWHTENPHGDYTISVGQHGQHLHAGEEGEAAVMVKKDGQSVADAKVFVAIFDKADAVELVAEQAAEYETVEGEPPHYAVLFEKIPDAKEFTLRYRVELPEGPEFTTTAKPDVEKH